MKLKWVLIVCAFFVLFTAACASSSNEPALGKYIMKDAENEEYSWVILKENNEFEFNRHIATSYRPSGTYSIEEDLLILKANEDEIYIFKVVKKTLVFQSGQFAEGIVEIGTVYELKKSSNSYTR
jgi:hypothetical protein